MDESMQFPGQCGLQIILNLDYSSSLDEQIDGITHLLDRAAAIIITDAVRNCVSWQETKKYAKVLGSWTNPNTGNRIRMWSITPATLRKLIKLRRCKREKLNKRKNK